MGYRDTGTSSNAEGRKHARPDKLPLVEVALGVLAGRITLEKTLKNRRKKHSTPRKNAGASKTSTRQNAALLIWRKP